LGVGTMDIEDGNQFILKVGKGKKKDIMIIQQMW
jgi:hypothetical protein